MKFTLEGFIKVKVKKGAFNLLTFKVIDTGIGIKKEIKENLGEKAYETHNFEGLN